MKYNIDLLRPYKNGWPLDSFFEEFFGPASTEKIESAAESFAPVCTIKDDETNYYLSADLPGVNKDDVRVEYKDNLLTISGERKQETETKENNWYLRESQYGSFKRSFRIREALDFEKIEARFENGVLKLTLPKSEPPKAHQIKIN